MIGAILGFLIFVFFVIAIHQSAFLVAHLTVTYVMAGIISVGGGVLALFMQKIIIVLSTACAGAFGVMAAVDYFAQEGRALLEIKAATSSSVTEPGIVHVRLYKCLSLIWHHFSISFKVPII